MRRYIGERFCFIHRYGILKPTFTTSNRKDLARMDRDREILYVSTEPIGTTGGPLIIMPSILLNDWFGCFDAPTPREATFRFSDPDAPATDYDRACDISDYLGMIPVGEGKALVLGDYPVASYVVIVGQVNTVIVRPILGDEHAINLALAYAFDGDASERIESYTPVATEHVLFDSASQGDEVLLEGPSEFLRFELRAPSYSIETHVYHPTKEIYVVTHNFIPTGS
jgi:hypothetical protein